MKHAIRWWTAVATLAVLAAAAPGQDKMTPPDSSFDARMYANLRDVINRGVTLYNNGEHTACYRLFQGSLMTLRPFFESRPELQKAINTGLSSAERDPLVWRRAFTLRSVLDKIRKELNPRKAEGGKLPTPNPEEKPEDKKPEDKKPEDKKPEKKPETKPEDKKPEDKKPEDKKPEAKKPEEKKKPERKLEELGQPREDK